MHVLGSSLGAGQQVRCIAAHGSNINFAAVTVLLRRLESAIARGYAAKGKAGILTAYAVSAFAEK